MIEVNNISFKYAGQKDLVFDDFSLRLEENNIYGLLGKNGTGKSTLLYLISGLLRPKKGTVSFDGNITPKGMSLRWKKNRGTIKINTTIETAIVMIATLVEFVYLSRNFII